MDQEYLKSILDYDPKTGLFFRLSDWRRRCLNPVKGSKNKYALISVNGKPYGAHRLAWLYVHGYLPEKPMCIDHIDGNGRNNKIENLRCVSHSENTRNASISRRNKSGIVGVFWCKNQNKWVATITCNRETHKLGLFDDKFEACCARKSAERRLGFHENHGKKKILQKNKPKRKRTTLWLPAFVRRNKNATLNYFKYINEGE